MHTHRVFVDGCFGCKLRTISFGTVPGAYRQTSGGSYYDQSLLDESGLPTPEEGKDLRSDALRTLKDPAAAKEEVVPVYVDGDGRPLFYP